jgi:GntR family transcriptional regulator
MVPHAALARPLDRAEGPLYRQAAAHLREAIARGVVKVGAALPTEADLAGGFGVSLITVRQALRELETDGLIRKRAAKTAIVVAQRPDRPQASSLNTLADIVANTKDARLEIVDYAPRRSALAARSFGLDGRASLPCLRGRLIVGRRPLAGITTYFPPEIGARLSREDFDDVVVFRSVERHLGIRLTGARITVRAELADVSLAALLEYEIGGPVLANQMLYYGPDGAPVEFTVAQHRADRYSLTYDLR